MGELAAPKGQTERAVRFATVLLRYPLSQPDGSQLSQRESQGVLPYLPAKLQFQHDCCRLVLRWALRRLYSRK